MIITDEKRLREKCEDALPKEYGEIIALLENELKHSASLGRPGIGLAAIQCGINKNVAIIRISDQYSVNLVNCKIKEEYDPFIFEGEGCLSFPGRFETTKRYGEIYITNNAIEPYSFIVGGLMGVVVQHELDHLDAKLLPDFAIKKSNKKLNPNDPCICGKIDILTRKIKKYKKCCGRING